MTALRETALQQPALRETALRVDGLTKKFSGIAATDNVSFAVAEGEMLALIGPNGAGKSTCFNMIGGQFRPTSGRITLFGADTTLMKPRDICRLGVGRTFQITATFASMTVCENVQMALLAHHREAWNLLRSARAAHVSAATRLLADVGLADQADRAAAVLAYGDLKRLELAIALAAAPRLLLMDEPTAGMAPQERVALMQLTRALAAAQNIAVLFTEHDMDVVFSVADRIIVLSRGTLIAAGTPAEIRANEVVRKIYLGTGATSGGH